MPQSHLKAESRSGRDDLAAYRQQQQRDLAAYARLEKRWSWLRLVTFLTCVAAIVAVAWFYGLLIAGLAATPMVAIFCCCVWRHLTWRQRRITTDRILVIVDESLRDAVGDRTPVRAWQRPADPQNPAMELPTIIESGPTWPLTDQERDDLDLYARPVGIFGLLNRNSTDQGARRLRDMLDAPCLSRQHIADRQAAIRWLQRQQEQRIAIMASALPLRKRCGQLDELALRLGRTELNRYPRASKWIRAWSGLSGLLFLYGLIQIFDRHFGWVSPLILLALFNMVLIGLNRAMFDQLREAVEPLVSLASALRGFQGVAQCAVENLPQETQLNVLRQRLDKVVTEGRIASLCERLAWMGLGGVARSLLNIVVFYDLHVAEAILVRFVPNRTTLLEGLAAMAEFEALASVACLACEQADMCYPTFVSDMKVSIAQGRHPLIAGQWSRPNDLELSGQGRMWVITGPNAAGKSTYLRMVGVNLLLAQVGSAVTAREMTLSPVRLMTDVRIRDDLAKHESYFLSEVRRLRRMVEDTGAETPLFGLIDEPFRGTNSSERTAAGVALTEYLMASGNLFLLATHEETLARTAAASDSAQNHHFQEHLTDKGIEFDYTLRPGPAVTRTAIAILEQERYPRTLLDRARDLMNS